MRYATVAIVTLAGSAALAAQQPTDSTIRQVDRVFDAFQGTNRPGCAVAVSRHGVLVLERAYGMANLETRTPITTTSIFHVASVSKQFTAMAVMLLEADGKLSLDDNIRKYLPEIPDYGTPITIRHLLQHTSGLRDQWELLALARGRFEENRITERDVLDIMPRQKALNFKPGAEYVYSNTGFTLAGTIVKRVSGKSLRDFADERIFRPLGMSSTHFHDDYTMLVPGRTSAYSPVAGTWRVSIPNYDTYGATSLFTTVGDLLKWQARFDNPSVSDAAIRNRMQTRAILSNGDTSTYALGLGVGRYRGALEVAHGGADAGYRSWLGRYPEHGLSIALACNTSMANSGFLAHGVADAFIGGSLAPVTTPPAPTAVVVSAASLQSRVGAYLQPTTLQVVELTMRDNSLVLGRGSAAPVLIPVAENRFRVTGQQVELAFRQGDRAGFDRIPLAGPRPVPFDRAPAARVSPATLAAFAGDYYSEETDSRFRVTASDTVLSFQTGTSNPATMRPVFADGFLGDGYTILFFRRGVGDVTAFEVSNGRMRRVRFERVASRR